MELGARMFYWPEHDATGCDINHAYNGRPAWSGLYNLVTHEVSPLKMQSNSFCMGGTFLHCGTLKSVGGNPVMEDHTSATDFGDVNGLQAIRVFEPCDFTDVHNCQMVENQDRIRMASPRWYATTIRLSDGSAMIMGGSKGGGWMNNATTNNPTIEFYPPKNIHNSNGLPIHMAYLVDTLNANLFPIAFVLSDGKIFIAAKHDATIHGWITNTKRRLPPIPNGVLLVKIPPLITRGIYAEQKVEMEEVMEPAGCLRHLMD
jgi:hypothetical protein